MDIQNILWLAFFCWTASWYFIKEMRMASGETFELIFSLTPSHVGFPSSLFSLVSLSLSSIHLTWNCLLGSNLPALISILSLCPCYLVLPSFLLFFSPFFPLLFDIYPILCPFHLEAFSPLPPLYHFIGNSHRSSLISALVLVVPTTSEWVSVCQ